MADNKPEVAVIMGSASDWETMKHACEMLDQFEVPYMKQVISAHRTPELMGEFAHNARANGLKIIIAGAAARPTCRAWSRRRPHRRSSACRTLPRAVRLGFAAVHRADAGRHSGGHHRRRQPGATNAGLLAVSILSTTDERLAKALQDYRDSLKEKVAESNAQLV